MKTLDVQDRLEYARAAVAVLRALPIAEAKMTYRGLSEAIGLLSPEDEWQPWHRQQIGDILSLVAATERQGGGESQLRFDLIVRASDGEPGSGFSKNSRIVTG